MATTIPADRLQLSEIASRQYAAMYRLSSSVELDDRLRALIELRASQLNGCAFCVDMHWKDARAGGETEERLYMLSAWRESPLYSTRERVALALCEAMTRIADDDVSDELWDRRRHHVRRRRPGAARIRDHRDQRLEPPVHHDAGAAGALPAGNIRRARPRRCRPLSAGCDHVRRQAR